MVFETILAVAELLKDPIIYVLAPLKRHIGYAFKCDSKVQTLQDEVKKLKNEKDRLQQSVDEAIRNAEVIHENVTEWLSTAKKDIEESDKLIQGKEEAMKTKCFVGVCPNFKTRYHLGKKAHKKALAVVKQLEFEKNLHPIAYRPPPQPVVRPSIYTREALPSRLLILNKIMDALKDPKLNMIGVHGMGGVGKTALAKEVQGKAMELKLFDTVILVAVSLTPDLRKIQQEIADPLGLKFEAEEFPGRASRLHQRLNKAKVLIILDDLWQKLDLNAVGNPFGDGYEGCKILLTSRSKELLSSEMSTQHEFSLNVLEEDEAWRLFEMSVGEVNHPELKAMTIEIAKKCAGLPLLIEKVAADLRNKESYEWSDMRNLLSSVESNTPIYTRVHKVIESSYEKLPDDQAKSLFLLCGLFGNANIEIHKLLLYSVGLGLFKPNIDSIEDARNRVLRLIRMLKNENLLLEGDRAGFVKIHDVVGDIARAIASRVQHAFVGTRKYRSPDLQNKDCTRISFPYCGIGELPGVLECPEAEVFLLFADEPGPNVPDSFFEKATKLKVEDFMGVHFVSGLPSSLGFLVGLQTLCLERCRFNNVGIVAELKQLEILSFSRSNIEELPLELRGLTGLKLLDLRNCRSLKVIPANVLSNLSSLEEMYILDSFDGWEAEGNASLVELKNLSRLTTLEIQVGDDGVLPEDWFFNGLRNYKIIVGGWGWYEIRRHETARNILMVEQRTSSIDLVHRMKEFVRGIEVLKLRDVKGVENLFYGSDRESINSGPLRVLTIMKCDTMKSLFSHSFHKYLSQLQEVKVESCRNMEAIVIEGRGDEVIELTQLTSLELSDLPNLIWFCKTSGRVPFPNLTSLKLSKCNGLKYVFTASMVKSLEKLNKLEIRECEIMEEIIQGKKFEEIGGEESINRIVFPKLEFILLDGLKNLKRLSSGYPIDFPFLRELRIDGCRAMENMASKVLNNQTTDHYPINEQVTFPNLELLCLDEMDKLRYIWSTGDIISLKNLQLVEIYNCPDLKYVFPASVASGLHQLQKLKIKECGVEVIIGNAEGETFEWPNLTHLALSNCYNFSRFGFNIFKSIPNVEHLELDHSCTKAIQSDGLPAVDIGPKLKKVTLISFGETDVPMLFGFLKRICALEHLIFRSCDLLADLIFSSGDERDVGDDELEYLQTLRHLELINIKNLKHILNKEHSPFNPNIYAISVSGCQDLMNIAPSSSSFQNLTTLHVTNCPKMTSLVTASAARTMVQLVKLKVSSCGMLEEIVADDISCAEHDVIVFNKLNSLELYYLDKLNSFCSGNYNFSFPLLEQVIVEGCSNMKIFCSGNLSTPKLQGIKQSWSGKQQWKGDLNATISCEISEWVGEPILPNQMHRFKGLRKLIVRDCNWVDVVFKLEELSPEDENVELLPELNELELVNLPMLTRLWNKAPQGILEFNKLNVLKIENCSRLKYAMTWSMASCLFKLQEIEVKNCEKMETIIMEEEAEDATGRGELECPSLKKITVRDCPSFKSLTTNGVQAMQQPNISFICKVFSNLEELFLDIKSITSILQFESMLQFEFPTTFFANLKKLEVAFLAGAITKSYVPLLYFLLIIPNLRQLGICHSSVQELFKFKGLNRKLKEAMLKLSLVRDLRLHNLDDLKQIYWQNSEYLASLFQSLETLEVTSCGGISSLASSPTSFQNLKKLKVHECNQLRNLITASVAKSMVQLEKLTVKSCKMLMEIVGDENEGRTDEVVFTKLKTLKLIDLLGLKSFSSGHYAFELPCLENVIVRGCPNLRVFCPGIILAPVLTSVNEWGFRDGDWEGDLNSTIEHLYKKMIGFIYLRDVKLSLFPILKDQWAAQFSFESLSCLIRLVVDDCGEFTNAISSHLLQHLEELEVLTVENCDSVEQVFDLEGPNAYRCETENLKELQLIDLPRLRDVWSKDSREILTFGNLQLLRVHNCSNLTHIFNLSMALSLPRLKHLEVKNCSLVEHIIVDGDEESKMQLHRTIFPSLQTMKLHCVIKLSSFYSTSGFLKWSSLESVEVVECPNMELFASSFLGNMVLIGLACMGLVLDLDG